MIFLTFAAGFALAYWLGWLPPSFSIPALLVCAFLARAPRTGGPSRRRGGYVKPPASATQNPETTFTSPLTLRVADYSSSFTPPGDLSRGEAIPRWHLEPSRFGAHISSGSGTVAHGGSGQPPDNAA